MGLAALAGLVTLVAGTVAATLGDGVNARSDEAEGHTPITLCHWVPAHGGSYITITVDDDAAEGNAHLQGHAGHANDIIPAPPEGCPATSEVTPTPTSTATSGTPSATPTGTIVATQTATRTATRTPHAGASVPTTQPTATRTATPVASPTSAGAVAGVEVNPGVAAFPSTGQGRPAANVDDVTVAGMLALLGAATFGTGMWRIRSRR